MKEGWKISTLKELSIISGDYGLSVPSKPFDGVRYLRITDITDDGGLNDELVSADIDGTKKKEELQEGDILFARTGATVGKTLVFKNEFGDCLYAGYLIRYRLKKELILPRYMHYVTHSEAYYNWVATNQEAAAQPNISAKKYNLLPVRYPSLEEQQRIVSRLDAAFAQIDALKANATQQLNEARALFQKALEEAMRPREGWEEKTLGELCDIYGRIGFRGYTTKDLVQSPSDGAISLSPSNIQDGKMDYSKLTYISWFKYEESPEIMIFDGDILLVKTGSSYGKSALVQGLPHEATINPQSVVLKNFKISNEFFAYQLRTNRVHLEFDHFVSGTAIPTFSQAKLSTVPIQYPSIEVQHSIVSRLDSLSEKVRALEEVQQRTQAECDALKQADRKSVV